MSWSIPNIVVLQAMCYFPFGSGFTAAVAEAPRIAERIVRLLNLTVGLDFVLHEHVVLPNGDPGLARNLAGFWRGGVRR